MKPFLLFILLLCTSLVAEAQWTRQHPFPNLEDILDIHIDTDGYGFAVGENATIFITDDAGQSWQWIDGPQNGWRLDAVNVLEGSLGMIAVAGGNGLLWTNDGGVTWDEVIGAPPGIHTLKLLGEEDIIVCNDVGVFRSLNGGASWIDLNLPATSFGEGGFILDAMHIWFITDIPNAIWSTSNGGSDWVMNTDLDRISLVIFYDALNGLAFDNRDVFSSDNGGLNWTVIDENLLPGTPEDVAYGEDMMHVFIAQRNGDATVSSDGGLTWSDNIPTGLPTDRCFSVFAVDNEHILLGADASSIVGSDDGLVTFDERTNRTRQGIYGMAWVNRLHGYAVGPNGTFLRTVDGGESWEDKSFGDRFHVSVAVFGSGHLWIGANQRLFHSTDNGETFEESLILTGHNIAFIKALSANEVIASSSGGTIIRTENAGMSWDTVYQGVASSLLDIEFPDNQTGYVCGFNSALLKSTDRGASWFALTPPEPGRQLEDMYFIDAMTGWLVSSNFTDSLWRTEDGGATWHSIGVPIERFWTGVYFMNRDTGIVVSRSNDEGRAYITFDGGLTWPSEQIIGHSYNGIVATAPPNAGVWIHGLGGNIELLPTCDAFPVISDLQGNSFPCLGDTIIYSITAENIDQYQWAVPGSWTILGGSNASMIEVVVGLATGFVTVQGANVCGTTGQLSMGVGANTPDDVFIMVSGSTLSVNTLADQYQWYQNGVPIAGATSSVFEAQSSGSYFAIITFHGGCSITTDTVIITITSIEPLTISELNISPIPAQNYISLNSSGALQSVRIYDMRGALIDEHLYPGVVIDLSRLENGMYLIEVRTSDLERRFRLPIVK